MLENCMLSSGNLINDDVTQVFFVFYFSVDVENTIKVKQDWQEENKKTQSVLVKALVLICGIE